MTEIDVSAIPDGEEQTASCSCCGRPVYEGSGTLQTESVAFADYWYRWSEGHEGRFTLAISPCSEFGDPIGSVAVVSGRVTDTDIVYSVLEPGDSPWTDFGTFGAILTRDAALNGEHSHNLFNIVDAVAANERRISSRILASGLQA
jgi:hypothetical protein